MIHIGEQVIIKSKEWYNEHKDTNGNVLVDTYFYFTPKMSAYCGQTAYVLEQDGVSKLVLDMPPTYRLDVCPNLEHDTCFPWSEHMFENKDCSKSSKEEMMNYTLNLQDFYKAMKVCDFLMECYKKGIPLNNLIK